MAAVENWDFFNMNVQSGLLEGRYMNAAFTMIAAGPPRLSAVSSGTVSALPASLAYPIGVLQSVNLGISSQIMRIWEIGSERSYFIRGRTQGQLGLGSIMYHGPSLLRRMWAYLDVSQEFTGGEQLFTNNANTRLNTSRQAGSKESYKLAPGYNNIWMDLASDVFSQPVGLLLYMKDSNDDVVGAFYFEYCHVANYGWNTDAGGTIMTENAAIMYEKIQPIEITSAVAVIRDSSSVQGIVGADVIGSAAGPVIT